VGVEKDRISGTSWKCGWKCEAEEGGFVSKGWSILGSGILLIVETEIGTPQRRRLLRFGITGTVLVFE